MPQKDLRARFKAHLILSKLIDPMDRILVAVSGGLDSVTLLHLLTALHHDLKISLQVVHVHHGLRGKEADRDLEFTRKLAAKLGLPFHFRKVDVRHHATRHKLSTEESARMLRYQSFEEVMTKSGTTKVATAHTADDQVETLLDHFLRGSGITGWRGMLPARGSYIRPLLPFTRQDLQKFVREHKIDFCDDSSNRDLKFRRNRIRRELVPYLNRHFNPDLTKVLVRTATVFDENEVFLRDFAANAYKALVSLKKNEIVLEIEPFLSYFNIVQKYILFHASEQLGIPRTDWTFDKIGRVLKSVAARKVGKKIPINREFESYIDHNGWVIRQRCVPATKLKINLEKQGCVHFRGFEIRWSTLRKPEFLRFEKSHRVEFVDFDKAGSSGCLRAWLPGDRFIPLNFSGQKKIASYFSDQKVPHGLRRDTPILETPAGIIWIGGFGIDDRFKVTKQTKRLLKLELIDKSDAV
ncbi:MAG TPA: tRNA lysidine(34) synthetase TilS [bacterium]